MLASASSFLEKLVADDNLGKVMVLGYRDENSVTSSLFLVMSVAQAVKLQQDLGVAIDKAVNYNAALAGF